MLICVLSLFVDDVAAQFLGPVLLYCSEQQLHAVLHLPYAHSFHSYGLWGSWYTEQI